MSRRLEELNELPRETAEARFFDCCGSRRWARRMTDARPFETPAELLARAEQVWKSLDDEDWLEAFAAHPKIGSRGNAPQQKKQSAEWSRAEQAGTQSAAESVLSDLEEANCLYEEKFGYIFIVCATGKSAEEMLAICRARLTNNAQTEIRIAAEEQKKITEIRLKKLLNAETS